MADEHKHEDTLLNEEVPERLAGVINGFFE